MAAKKKTKVKRTKKKVSAKTTARKKLAVKEKAPKKKRTTKSVPKKKVAKRKRFSAKKKVLVSKRSVALKKVVATQRAPRDEDENPYPVAIPRKTPGELSGAESGDLQGLSDVEGADAESVDELLEEGNAFEAGIVKGVEDADNADEREVRTHEVLEDDVPEEYLEDEDK